MIVSGLYELIENHCKGTKKFWDLQIFHEGWSEKFKIVLVMQSFGYRKRGVPCDTPRLRWGLIVHELSEIIVRVKRDKN